MKYHFGQFKHLHRHIFSFMCAYRKILHKAFAIFEPPLVILLFITRSQLLGLRSAEPGMVL
jgi:hypothetical protein